MVLTLLEIETKVSSDKWVKKVLAACISHTGVLPIISPRQFGYVLYQLPEYY